MQLVQRAWKGEEGWRNKTTLDAMTYGCKELQPDSKFGKMQSEQKLKHPEAIKT